MQSTNAIAENHAIDLRQTVVDFETQLILKALEKAQGNKSAAARLLGVNRTTLVMKLKARGLAVAPAKPE